ncbi:TfoX/Sxy family protein [Paenirhodobacter populi]|uniref:Competence protein TfoX n=1 Tax=Paenirhodobacter populi TaxID=2306993 RepID=A0A443KLR4_9RHOB|nr:TfoX/Sxy family protein [Sinirhodobacter populi]RWR08354.1 competence protein TfoX [Sinirhodobacter populi]RWR32025.1 competence protein TfoX [Sinirhodobacter populi]RWR33758.1 competence protein TfoX [Sinirhodobacter populi]
MATAPETADFLLEQLGGRVRLHRMFGEYAVKQGNKTLALLCDDALFVRQLPGVTAYLGDPVEGFPYPGAKPWWRIEADLWEDADWLRGLIDLLAELLPEPAPKGRGRRN